MTSQSQLNDWAFYAQIMGSTAKRVQHRAQALASYNGKSAAELQDIIKKLEADQNADKRRMNEIDKELKTLEETQSRRRAFLDLAREIQVKGASKIEEEFEKNRKIISTMMDVAPTLY